MNLDQTVVSLVVIFILAAALCACHVATTLHLQGILNPAFDPFWIPRLLFPPAGFKQKYLWTLYYASALVVPLARQAIFEDIPYDFRSKVTRRTMLIVVLYLLLTLLAGVALIALGVQTVRTVIWVWNQFPELVPPYEPPPLPPPAL